MDNVIYDYKWIMNQEARLRYSQTNDPGDLYPAIEEPIHMYDITYRILEIAYNSTIIRVGNSVGHLTKSLLAYESDSAHTNLVRSLVKYALDCKFGWNISSPRYDRSEIDEAILLHDLPENETGDIPDNRNRNEAKKLAQENAYFENILATYKPSYKYHSEKITRLLHEMQEKSTVEGRLLYVADKASAIIMMLTYDRIGLYPYVYPNEPTVSKIDPSELAMCSKLANGGIKLSELWTVDYLFGRNIAQFDESGFFTAIIVMATLIVHGEWYDWREKQYK